MDLRECRRDRGLTQEQLQAKSGIDQSLISSIETGKVKSPSWDTVYRLARALDVAPDQLFPISETQTEVA